MKRIDLSIIIPTWNSEPYLTICLEHLNKQTNKAFEIIIVDNGSDEFDFASIKSKWPNLNINTKLLEKNHGFAVACNIGVTLSKAKWIAFLNADAFPNGDWVEQFVLALRNFPESAAFGSTILKQRKPYFIDSAWDTYNISGVAWKELNNYPINELPGEPIRIFSPCAAACFYRKDVFFEIGGFDTDYFSYFEDVDLGFRLNLNGYHCMFLPKAIVYHVGSTSTGEESDFVLYHYHRNMVWTFLKNMPLLLFFAYLPLHILANIRLILRNLNNHCGKVIVKAKIDAIKETKKILSKRKHIQNNKYLNAFDLKSLLDKGVWSPYQIGKKLNKYLRENGIPIHFDSKIKEIKKTIDVVIITDKQNIDAFYYLKPFIKYLNKGVSSIIVVDRSNGYSGSYRKELGNKVYFDNYLGYHTDGSIFNRTIKKGAGNYVLILESFINMDGSTIKQLIDVLNSNQFSEDVALIGAELKNPNGTIVVGDSAFPRFKELLFNNFSLRFIENNIFQKIPKNQNNNKKYYFVDSVVGPFILLKREVFYQINGFSECINPHFAKIDFAFRAHQIGFDSILLKGLNVLSFEQNSEHLNISQLLSDYWINLLKFIRKNASFGKIKSFILLLKILFYETLLLIIQSIIKKEFQYIKSILNASNQTLKANLS